MVRTEIREEKRARRVVATFTVGGREYARLAAVADKLNEWARQTGQDDDNTPVTVLPFYLTTFDLEDDNGMYAADNVVDALDVEGAVKSTYLAEMREAVAEADRRFAAGERGAPARL